MKILFKSALVTTCLLSGCSAFTSRTEDYASWIPGDDILKVNEKNEAWTECFSRDPNDCKEKYIKIDDVSRLKPGVIQAANKTYYCKLSDIKDAEIQTAKCTSNGWIYGDELLVSQNSTKKYHKCDSAGIRVMKASYEKAGEKFGRLSSFLSLNNNGELFLYKASNAMNIEIDKSDGSIYKTVIGAPLPPSASEPLTKLLIESTNIFSPRKARTLNEALAIQVDYETDSDPRKIASTGSSYTCKIFFNSEGNVESGWYNVSSTNNENSVTTRWQKTN